MGACATVAVSTVAGATVTAARSVSRARCYYGPEVSRLQADSQASFGLNVWYVYIHWHI